MGKNNKQGGEIFKGVLLTHLILFLHLLIIGILGLLVIFFRGVSQYMTWILLGGFIFIVVTGSLIFWRLKYRRSKLRHEMQQSSEFKDRSFEISFLGGLASVRFGEPNNSRKLEELTPNPKLQLEDPETLRFKELTELADMFEKKLITLQEYEQMKKNIFKAY